MIDRVKFDGPPGILVWKFPSDQLSWGAQVIVNQSQEALFFKGGEALDLLGPGTHTLKTANIPLLRAVVNAVYGGDSPFAAEIYFVNKAAQLDGKWGTKTPIPVLDPKFNVPLPIRAYGRFGVKVADARKLVVGLSGTVSQYSVESLTEHFRGLVMTKVKDYIAETVAVRKVCFLEISTLLEEISADLHAKLKGDFAGYGVELLNFFLESVTAPDDDPVVARLKKILGDKAELDILGVDYKTKRTFDALEAGGGAGAGLGAGMGLGMGMGVGAQMGQQAAAAMGASAACPACKASVAPGAKFCPQCGGALGPKRCAKCSAEAAPGAKFCSACGSSF
ncbi:MAG: SPFH domain-containing protein [Elusimicrobia bacterium]|nr:SPFH domain-containing protein [Elusimicrobiota bacterium]